MRYINITITYYTNRHRKNQWAGPILNRFLLVSLKIPVLSKLVLLVATFWFLQYRILRSAAIAISIQNCMMLGLRVVQNVRHPKHLSDCLMPSGGPLAFASFRRPYPFPPGFLLVPIFSSGCSDSKALQLLAICIHALPIPLRLSWSHKKMIAALPAIIE